MNIAFEQEIKIFARHIAAVQTQVFGYDKQKNVKVFSTIEEIWYTLSLH